MEKIIQSTDKFIRKSEVSKLTGLSSTSIWRLSKAGDFPKSIKIGENAVRYSLNEVVAWIEAKKLTRG
ncbi:AlpA family phage regulatory protein [Pasteurella multocida]|uniref:helix-turn-helix transcriptional regulator n=1 Tax=Pasteurella multocida TaxID=747 RepID=UPI002C25B388|nr:AlpA family phage regulatory protein [Pasteurella multocida]MEB3502612.1 AlpA family phage regulatory protein [Pasteurella multocida]